MLIHGRCHCGNVSFTLNWTPEPEVIPARACGCTFCTRHGGVWTSCPTGALDVCVVDAARVSRYAFGTRTAQFHLCTVCGVATVVTSEIDGRTFAVVNVNCFENVAPALLQQSRASFEEENEHERLARRARGWIPRVRFATARDA
jgi:hypothetical protein